jgi:hypothetical protein
LKNSLIYSQLMEGVGHRRDPLAGSGANVAPFLASLGRRNEPGALRTAKRGDKAAIAEQQERKKAQQEEGSTTRTTNRPGQQEQTDGGSRRRSD